MWFHSIYANEDGFSLTEALVALAITGASLGVGYEVFSNSLQAQALAGQKVQAVQIAQAKLAAADISGDWQSLNGGGVISDFYAWKREANPVLESRALNETTLRLIPVEVVVEVKWPADGNPPRSLRFYSIRLFRTGDNR